MSFSADDDLIAEFVVESNEHLADVESQLLSIEAAGADIDVDLVNTVFRAVHSVKGAAGFLGLSTINSLAHSLENVLNLVRNREMVPTPEIVDVMLRSADVLRNLLNDTASSNDVDVSQHINALEAIATGEAAEETTAPAPPATEDSVECETTECETTECETAAGESPVESDSEAVADTSEPEQEVPAAETSTDKTPATTPPVAPTTPSAPASNNNQESAQRVQSVAKPETSIRVPVGVLDHLMNLAGELVLSRNRMLQVVASPQKGGIEKVAAGVDQVTSELQEAIMQTRMQPIGNVLEKFRRVVRDLSTKLGKQCSLNIEGKDVEVDKTIIEAIGDPLTHLVRNSVDHGVETPDVRRQNGKQPRGTISLRAYHQAGKVRIDIIDDGGGMDAEKLKSKAVSKGVISTEQADAMSSREAFRLIFHPGFSTAAAVTDVSGRGVGMDVVRTNIERLGGTVDVESELGSGTTIQITLPLTLAIIPSIIVRTQAERYAIPQVNIVELVRVRPTELSKRINRVKGAEVLRLRGSLLPLVRLGDVLELDESVDASESRPMNIIVLETGTVRYGLLVDGIDDSEEIVVKPLGRHVKHCGCLAGATILGGGHVALILDIAGIASRSQLRVTNDDSGPAQDDENAVRRRSDTQSLLMFTNSGDDRLAVPMSLVSRIERVRTIQIDHIGGQLLLQYRGSSLPLINPHDHIDTRPYDEVEQVYIIVFSITGREVGIVAPMLEDIIDVDDNIDSETFRETGVAGSFVRDAKTVRLIDVFELAHAALPQWFESHDTETASQRKTILFAEDSTFFRKQVRGFLEGEGYYVLECEDGQDAWNLLLTEEHDVDLVITDIEMPNMDGFELCRRIKGHPNLKSVPVIALTSLANDEHVQKGRACGVDEYHVKLDRERILAAVERTTNGNAIGVHSPNEECFA